MERAYSYKRTTQEGRIFVKKIARRFKKEFYFFGLLSLTLNFEGGHWITLSCGKKGFERTVGRKGKEFFGKYKSPSAILGAMLGYSKDTSLIGKCVGVKIISYPHSVVIRRFSNFEEFKRWVELPYDDKLEVRVRGEELKILREFCRELGIREGDLVRGSINFWMAYEYLKSKRS